MNNEIQNKLREMKKEFERVFGGAAEFAVRAPGRVNLIGEHTDYNDGYVLPIGLDQAVYAVGRPAAGRASRFHSMHFNETREFNPDERFVRGEVGWGTYVEGVARALEQDTGEKLRGVEAVVWGDVPLRSGLSSSAALEVASGFFILCANGAEMPLSRLAVVCQQAENKYAGVQCGIMDQFASCLAGADAAIFLDCRSLDFEYVPVPLEDHTLLVMNTGVERTLAGSAYNDRRRACETGVAILKNHLPSIRALRDVSVEQFESLKDTLPPEIMQKCRHIVTEDERVLRSVERLRMGDLAAFGRLMSESHESLRRDYEVTCRELDLLHDNAMSMTGVLGARMTGAGFGGCAIALVESAAADDVQAKITDIYFRETGIALESYRTKARQGARRLDL